MIHLDRVSKSFDGDQWAVREFDLEIPEGSWFVLIGESGSGKTTTLKMINRLVEPTSGQVRVDGVDISTQSPEDLRRGIGYCLQHHGLFPHWTVSENVGAVPRLLGWDEARIRDRVHELLETVGLPVEDFGDRWPHQLSGGQRQRVGVARALAARARILLMDEPFGALDPVTRHRLQEEVRGLHDRLGLTTVMVTHDMAGALHLADRIAILDQGRLIRLGTPRELIADPGDPRVSALLDAPRRHAERLAELTS